MKELNRQIKEGSYSRIYLLFGEDGYLVKFYRDRLVWGILNGSPDGNMNYHYLQGDEATVEAIISQANMQPFFADELLIVVSNSGLCKRSNDLAEKLDGIPETSRIIFVEHDVDKRNSLYKYIKDKGIAAEMLHKKDTDLVTWVASYLKKGDCLITGRAARLLISRVGEDMQQLSCELEKLIGYAGDDRKIDIDAVEDITTPSLSNRIFVMMDHIVSGNIRKALELYKDLLALRESPMSILALLARHYNILLQMKELQGEQEKRIAAILKVPQFTIKKYKSQSSAYTRMGLLKIISECIQTEQAIKEGRIAQRTGIEVLIIEAGKAVG